VIHPMLATLYVLADDVLAAPTFTDTPPPGSDHFLTMGGWVKWGGGFACVVGLIIVAATMAIQHRRGSGGEHGAALGWVALASVLCGVASGLVTGLGA